MKDQLFRQLDWHGSRLRSILSVDLESMANPGRPREPRQASVWMPFHRAKKVKVDTSETVKNGTRREEDSC